MGIQIGLAEVMTKMLLYYLHERVWFKIDLEKESTNWRHIAKTLSWRVVGTVDTMVLAWIISGDPMVGLKVGAIEVVTKMILYYLHEKIWYTSNFGLDQRKSNINPDNKNVNIFPKAYAVDRNMRSKLKDHRACVLWFTGLSVSWNSTIANRVEKALLGQGMHTFCLDEDKVQGRLISNAGSSAENRTEDLRRIAEVAKLFVDSGIIVSAACNSPLAKDRELVRNIIGKEDFLEIYLNTSIEEGDHRDAKGLDTKAGAGESNDVTEINSPYEPPAAPHLKINTEKDTIQQAVDKVLKFILTKVKGQGKE